MNDNINGEREPLSVEQLAKRLHRSVKTIWNWCYSGRIPKSAQHRIGGKGAPFFYWDEIECLFQAEDPMIERGETEIRANVLYSTRVLAHKLKMSVEAIQNFVDKDMLRFIPACDGSTQFLGKHVLEFLDRYAQTVIKPGLRLGTAGAMARKAWDVNVAEKKQESTTKTQRPRSKHEPKT